MAGRGAPGRMSWKIVPLAIPALLLLAAVPATDAGGVGLAGVCVYVGGLDAPQETKVTTDDHCGPSLTSITVEDDGTVIMCVKTKCVEVHLLLDEHVTELIHRLTGWELP